MALHPSLKSAATLMLIAGMAVLLSGCGFQLRGAPPVSSALEPLAVECSTPVPDTLCRSLREQLKLGNVRIAPVADADYILRLKNFERDRRASAITAQAAAAEYTLRHSVDLEVISADRVPMVATTRLTTSESYRYDETNVLARQREEETLQQQMDDRLAQQAIFRLAPLTPQRIDAIREEFQRKQEPEAQPQANHED